MKTLLVFPFIFFLSVFLPFYISAQIGKVGINTTTPSAMLHVKDSSVVFTGVTVNLPPNLGPPPISGPGARMMWYPGKSAFRVGQVDGAEWNRDSIGFYSAAFNYGTKAKGNSSFAIGFGTGKIHKYYWCSNRSTQHELLYHSGKVRTH